MRYSSLGVTRESAAESAAKITLVNFWSLLDSSPIPDDDICALSPKTLYFLMGRPMRFGVDIDRCDERSRVKKFATFQEW